MGHRRRAGQDSARHRHGHLHGRDRRSGGRDPGGGGERRIVAVVRDEHRHAWMGAALDALLAARPDTIVVEMGLPQSDPRGSLHIATHGAARVCGLAAAEAITGTNA